MTIASIVAKLRGLLKRPSGRAGLVAAILIFPYAVGSLARGVVESIWMQWGIGLFMVVGGMIAIGLVFLVGLVIYCVLRWIATGKSPGFLD